MGPCWISLLQEEETVLERGCTLDSDFDIYRGDVRSSSCCLQGCGVGAQLKERAARFMEEPSVSAPDC
eukprot:1138728-Pelagomonas_calceolata.AAC.2